MKKVPSLLPLVVFGLLMTFSDAFAARDASFVAPTVSGGGSMAIDAVKVEPKGEVDVGETPINLGRRATFFFVNQTMQPINIESVAANGDSNVRAEIMGDDCSRTKIIAPSSKCSVTIEATPTATGSWTAELLMTHDAAGRITRARVLGKTGGGTADKQDTGLSVSAKEIKPVDFGEVEVGTDKAVRSALMVNDSNESITVLSIEVIAPENGLERVEQGCLPDMELKVGESCPVTMLWRPESRGIISTDLIIRHTGRMGFAVIPIRGKAIVPKDSTATGKETASSTSSSSTGKNRIPMPDALGAQDIQREMEGKIPPLVVDDIPVATSTRKTSVAAGNAPSSLPQLVGTVGNRAIICKPDGTTVVVANGEEVSLAEGSSMKILNITPKEATVVIGGKQTVLRLTSASALTSRAAAASREEGKMEQDENKLRSRSTSSSAGAGRLEGKSVDLPMSK